jgi:gliding motility-associated-like protein
MKALSTFSYVFIALFLLSFGSVSSQEVFDGYQSERKDFIIDKKGNHVMFDNLIPGVTYVFHFQGNGITENTNLVFEKNSISFFECTKRMVEFIPTKETVHADFHEIIWAHKAKRNVHATFFSKNNMKKGPDGITLIDGFDPQYLVENVLLGDACMDVNNVSAPGEPIQYGVFFDGELSIIIETGIILSSGSIYNAEGPNEATGTSTATGGPGDPDLALISGTTMNDCAVLEFDFTPDQDSVRFQYVFASEEYCDYVGSPFNDAFGFFLSGPGISGPFTNNAVNLAVLPNGTQVSINTVNFTTNGMYYVDNTPADSPISGGCTPEEIANNPKAQLEIEFDGFTVPLIAEHPTIPCSTYHIKLAVGDGTDQIFDSAVFIEKNSFISGTSETIVTEVGYTAEDAFEAIEGCEGAYIVFRRIAFNTFTDLTFDINVLPSSTAEEGEDFADIPSTFTIPAGQWSDTLWLDIFSDDIIEGIEVIEMSVIGFCACTDPTFEVYINDDPLMFADSEVQEFCEPTNVLLNVDVWGGTPNYTYEWENGSTTPTAIAPFWESGSQFVTVTDECGQEIVHEIFVEIYEPTDTTVQVSICDGEFYEAGGAPQFVDGTYADYYQTIHNCDSIVYTELTVLPHSDYDTVAYICEGDCVFIGGIQICSPGSSWIDLSGQAANGCDSTIYYEVILNLPIAVVFDPPVLTCDVDSVQMNTTGSTTGSGVTYFWTGPDGWTSNEQNPWVTEPGDYEFYIEQEFDGVLCTSNGWPVEVEADTMPPFIDPGESQTFGCDSDSIKIFDASNSDFTDAIFEWNGPNGFVSVDTIIYVQDTGAYTLTIIDTTNNCISDSTIFLSINQSTPNVSTEGGYVGCNSDPINIFAYSDIPGVDYNWEGPNGFTDTVFNPLVLDPGVYYVTVSNGGPCFAVDTTEVLFDSAVPDLTASGNTITCDNPSVQINSSSNTNGVSYYWTGPNGFTSNDQNPTVDEAGSYTIVVTGLNGCQDSMQVDVALNEIYADLSTTPDTIDCNLGQVDLSLTVDISDVDYTWSGPNAFTSVDANPSVTDAGWYFVTVTSNTGCESYDSIQISLDTLIPDFLVDYNDIDCYAPNSLVELSGLDGSETIEWTGPNGYTSDSDVIDVSVSGAYTVVVTAENGCTNESTINISEDLLIPDVAATGDTVSCTSGTATLTGITQTQNASIDWKNESGQYVGNGDIVLVGSPGIYTCIVTNLANGCADSVTVEVFQDVNVPDIATLGTTIDCNASNFFIEVSSLAGVSFEWEGPNGFMSNSTNPEVVDAGTYTVTVTAANGCKAVENVEVFDDTQSPFILLDAEEINCNNTSSVIEMDATGNGNTYEWEGPNGYTSGAEDPIVDEGGFYYVTVTSMNGCTSEDVIQVIEDSVIPSLDVNSSNVITCIDDFATLSAISDNPNVSFSWEGPNGYTSDESSPQVTEAGTYNIVIEAPNGCTENSTVEVLIDTVSAQVSVQDGYIDCNNPSVTIDVQIANGSNEVFNWQGPNGYNSNNEDPVITTGGEYFVTVTNDNGCETFASLTVDENMEEPVTQVDVIEFDCDGSDAVLSADLTGSQYTYNWESEAGSTYNGESIEVQESGIFSLTIVDNTNGCSFITSAEVQAFDPVLSYDLLTTDPACLNEFGSISIINIEGGGSDVQYSIDGGNSFQSSPDFNNLESGVYDIVIVDEYDCVLADQATLAEVVEFDLTGETFHIINLGDNLNLDLETTLDPIDIDTIIWSPGIDLSCTDCLDPLFTGSGDASYTVTVIDNNGCSEEIQIEIRVVLKDLYIPNIFSPNGDGINNVFTIFGDETQVQQINNLRIFDRWGNMVFENENVALNDLDAGWDGSFKGRPVNPGVFVYAIEVLMVNGDVRSYGGDVTVIK